MIPLGRRMLKAWKAGYTLFGPVGASRERGDVGRRECVYFASDRGRRGAVAPSAGALGRGVAGYSRGYRRSGAADGRPAELRGGGRGQPASRRTRVSGDQRRPGSERLDGGAAQG